MALINCNIIRSETAQSRTQSGYCRVINDTTLCLENIEIITKYKRHLDGLQIFNVIYTPTGKYLFSN